MEEREQNNPDVWHDEDRINVLYSPLREKSLNPNSWNQKIKFWTKMIIDESKQCDNSIINMKSFPSKFARHGKVPKCLESVIEEMTRNGKIKKLPEHAEMMTQPSDGWLPWCYNTLMKAPLSWGWRYFQKDTKPQAESYIVVEMIKVKAGRVLQMFHAEMDCDLTDCVIEYSCLKCKCWNICQSEEEFQVVIQELMADNKVAIHKMEKEFIVKFAGRTDKTVKSVQERDINIYCIKKSVDSLQKLIDKAAEDIKKHTEDAKEAKKKGMTQAALRSLRHRKRSRVKAERFTRSLDMLEDVLNRIENAVSEDMVLQAVSGGTAALKNLTSQMDISKVEGTMDNLAEAIDEHEEIESEMINMPVRLGDATQSELEMELDSLLQETRTHDKCTDSLDDITEGFLDMELPDVPSFSPESPKKVKTTGNKKPIAFASNF